MLKAYQYRIYPNNERKVQKVQIAKTFGCCRFVYNKTLAYQKETYEKEKKSVSKTDCNNYCTRELKKEYEWLKEVAKLHREFSGQIKSATISQVPSEKLFTLMLILATTSSTLSIPTFAEEISTKEENTIELEKIEEVEPRASLYFSSYTYDLEPSSKNGYLDFSSLVVRTNRTDELTLPFLKAWGS